MDNHWEGLTLMDNFKRILEFVPSLAGHEHLVNNMFKLFIHMTMTRDSVEKVKLFFSLVDLKNKLFSLCKSEEDCNRVRQPLSHCQLL
ncbi:hypothetical protein BCR33DRAFT_718716 [Rhizoclosmatium globosum]|uniref:Uncharacterized protein n=1 Tax=Rhizoclosmatium globosum TaxID=329046 RepID=A0A1Y2C3C3_9FUNG|nr:hypothetical protein BCR33DRAFT_718716 [Rhizoclosmatium globosum]|eukprot:ORY41553.1 hypothetical protein BCR33DRAFT_718716 [Rhizoclosmatium globosum]